MSVFYDLNKTPRNILNQAIVRAIISENNGALFDPSDLSTLYQDSAGTTPVTAVEQPVGLMLDKSGNGYHATQSITASRPTLSARKNILLATEELATQSVTTLAATYTLSFTGTGSVSLSGTATGTLTGTGTGRVSLTFTPTAGTLTITVSGSVMKAQLGVSSVVTSYQRVTTATDYDVSAHYYFLRFDGVDDYLNLPYMGLYVNGSASVVAALTMTNANPQRLVHEANTGNSTPFYGLFRNAGGVCGLGALDDTGFAFVSNTAYFGDTSKVKVISEVDFGANATTFINSISSDSDNYSRVGRTVTLNNTTIGASVSTNTAGYINSNLYGLIITKSALTDAQRVTCERYLGRKAGVIL